jgi:hypothetical protein
MKHEQGGNNESLWNEATGGQYAYGAEEHHSDRRKPSWTGLAAIN